MRKGTANCCSVMASEDSTVDVVYARYRNAAHRRERTKEATMVVLVTGGMLVSRTLIAIVGGVSRLLFFSVDSIPCRLS